MARHHMEKDELAFQYTYFRKDTWGNDKPDTYEIDLAALRQVNTVTGMERKLRVVEMVCW